MKRAAFLSFLAFALLAVGLALRDGKVAALSLPLLCYLALGLLQYPDRAQLEVDAHLTQSSVTEGSIVGVWVQVRNTGASLPQLRIQDRLPVELTVHDGSAVTLGSLARGASHQISYSIRSTRGVHSFERVDFVASDPLGLFKRAFHQTTSRTMLVRPSLRRLRHVDLQPLRMASMPACTALAAADRGLNFMDCARMLRETPDDGSTGKPAPAMATNFLSMSLSRSARWRLGSLSMPDREATSWLVADPRSPIQSRRQPH